MKAWIYILEHNMLKFVNLVRNDNFYNINLVDIFLAFFSDTFFFFGDTVDTYWIFFFVFFFFHTPCKYNNLMQYEVLHRKGTLCSLWYVLKN